MKTKRVFSAVLAAALVLGLAACGNSPTGEPTTTPPATGPATATLVADFSGDRKEYPAQVDGEVTAEALAQALSELTGLDFILTAKAETGKLTIDWAKSSTLVANLDDREQKADFHFFDAESMRWFMMDSMYQTVLKNLPDSGAVYYTMDGGKELAFEELAPVNVFPVDQPYKGSAAYAEGQGRGDVIPPAPGDVSWDGSFGSDEYALVIEGYDLKTIQFTILHATRVFGKGTATLDAANPCVATGDGFEFTLDADDRNVLVTGDGFEQNFVRAKDSAVG
jgi:predicted small lipoprotein YifL